MQNQTIINPHVQHMAKASMRGRFLIHMINLTSSLNLGIVQELTLEPLKLSPAFASQNTGLQIYVDLSS